MATKKEMAEAIIKALYNVDVVSERGTEKVRRFMRRTKVELEWAYEKALKILKQKEEKERMAKEPTARSASKILDAAVAFVEDIVMDTKRQEDHKEDCSCEDCAFLRAQADGEVCATCGCLVGHGCPCTDDRGG